MNSSRRTAIVFLVLDALMLVLVFNIFAWLRGLAVSNHGLIFEPLWVPALVLIIVIFLIDGYDTRTDMMSLDYTSLHSIALLAALVSMFLVTYVFFPEGYPLQSSRGVIALGYLSLIPLTLSYRRLSYRLSLERRRHRELVFLGDFKSCLAFRDECRRNSMETKITFAITDGMPDGTMPDDSFQSSNEVLGRMQRGELAIEALVLRESARELEPEISERIVQLYFSGVPTYTLELFHQVYWRKIPLYRLNQTWLFQEGFQIAREPVFERLKRLTDIGLAAIGLLLAAPLIGLAALAIWIDDRGPIFFTQTRIGRNHVPFRLLKLRSMRVATAGTGDLYTQPGDARITRIGRFLRTSRLDELPQLWNVFRGEMSIIGPRAEWDRLVEDYEKKIPCYYFRHLVKPGITGWAQVNYPYGANLEDTVRKLEYDLYYVRHFSFLLDASIVLKTIHIMLFGKGR